MLSAFPRPASLPWFQATPSASVGGVFFWPSAALAFAGAGFLFNPLDAVMKWYFRNRERFSELCLVGFLGFLLGVLAGAFLMASF